MKIIIVVAVVIGLIGLGLAIRSYLSINRSMVCWGQVKDMYEKSDGDGTTYGIVAEFTAHDQRTYQYRSSWTSSSPGYGVGDGIRIYYDPEDPNRNGIMSFMAAYGVPVILMMACVMTCLICFMIANSYAIMDVIHPGKFLKTEEIERGARY